MTPRWCVNIDGMSVQFDRKPTPEMIEKARTDLTAIRDAIPPLTDDQAARQDAARARIAARIARLRGEP